MCIFAIKNVSIMVLEIKNGSLSLDGNLLFGDLNFTVRGGEIVCLCGNTGCGKTMIAKSIIGLCALDSGFISIDGTLVTPSSAPTFRRITAYVPQNLSHLGALAHPEECEMPEPENYTVFAPSLLAVEKNASTLTPHLTEKETVQLIKQTLTAHTKKQIVIADAPTDGFSDEAANVVVSLLRQQAEEGKPVLVISNDSRVTIKADKLIHLT